MTIAARIAIATIDRSMPATSMTSVWPSASTPITDAWKRMIETFDGCMKRPPDITVATIRKAMKTSTMAFCWTNWRRRAPASSLVVRVVWLVAVMCARAPFAGWRRAGAGC